MTIGDYMWYGGVIGVFIGIIVLIISQIVLYSKKKKLLAQLRNYYN